MNYIVFDLEFNQPSSKEQLILEPFPFCFEVVQIGAVKMDEKYKIRETIDIQVEPIFYKNIGNAARSRIGLYSKHFQRSMAFSEAYERFIDFCGKEYCLFTWGATDINILNNNALIHRLQPINSEACFDVQKMFFEYVGGNKSQIKLQDAVKEMRLEQYTAHNAFNDAYSTAEILSKIEVDLRKGYIPNKTVQTTSVLYVNEECASKKDAIQRVRDSKIACSCGAHADVDRVIILGKIKAIATSRCICGKEYFVVAKFLKNKVNEKITLRCHKWIMGEDLKAFYSKQKSIDDAITEYAKKYNSKHKGEGV